MRAVDVVAERGGAGWGGAARRRTNCPVDQIIRFVPTWTAVVCLCSRLAVRVFGRSVGACGRLLVVGLSLLVFLAQPPQLSQLPPLKPLKPLPPVP